MPLKLDAKNNKLKINWSVEGSLAHLSNISYSFIPSTKFRKKNKKR